MKLIDNLFFFDNYLTIVIFILFISFFFNFIIFLVNYNVNLLNNLSSFYFKSRYLSNINIFSIYFYFLISIFIYFYTLIIFLFFDTFSFCKFLCLNFVFFSLYLSIDSLSIIFILLLVLIIPLCILINIFHSIQISFLKILTYDLSYFFSFHIKREDDSGISFLNHHLYNNTSLFFFFFLEIILFFFFLTSDILSFYILFEMSVIPVYFITGIYGSRVNKITSTHYLFFFTTLSSIFFFISVLFLNFLFGSTSLFILVNIYIPFFIQKMLWLFIFISFSIKIPIFPFHLWLPEAHVESSTEGSVILASLLLKLGLYGILKFLIPICSLASIYFSPLVYSISLIGIIYISFNIFVQLDIKKIIAYSSIIHMNFVLLGLFSYTFSGVTGGLFLMFSHGIISSGLFIVVGFLYSRFGSRLLFYYQGISNYFSVFSSFFFFFILNNLALPGTGGFIGEILIFLGIFYKNFIIGILSLFSNFFGGIYSLVVYSKIFHGTSSLITFSEEEGLNNDSIVRVLKLEYYILAILSLYIFFLGIFPNIIFYKLNFYVFEILFFFTN